MILDSARPESRPTSVTARKTNGVFACFDGELNSLLEDIPFIRDPEPELSLSMSSLPGFLTHYFEADKGPFRNICDLPDQEIEAVIEAEKHAGTAFNRFALGPHFFKIRRAADDLLIEKYTEKFGVKPRIRPYFAVLGAFDRTTTMYRDARSIAISISLLSPEHLTFMYPDHFHLVWSKKLFRPDFPYSYQPFHDLLFTYTELPEAMKIYDFDARIADAKRRGIWVCSYIEAHIWDPDIKFKVRSVLPANRNR
jgi:hypothetical protein